MAAADIEIVDDSFAGVERHTLYLGGEPKAAVVVRNQVVSLQWQVYGPQTWDPEGRALMQGLLELSVLADRLSVKLKKFSREAAE